MDLPASGDVGHLVPSTQLSQGKRPGHPIPTFLQDRDIAAQPSTEPLFAILVVREPLWKVVERT